jgi:hypothetical protein
LVKVKVYPYMVNVFQEGNQVLKATCYVPR